LDIQERQKILRMLVKEIVVGKDKITIHHSIPTNEEKKTKDIKSYLLCTGSNQSVAVKYIPSCSFRQMDGKTPS
jgi:site-specific DNA recombinase